VLFHYNGHGVPCPTDKGEIWLFNKSYTQYIPLAIQDLRGSVVGSPAVYVFDCSGAGQVLPHFALPPPPGFFGDDEPGTPGTPGGGFRGDYSPTSPRGPPPGFSQAQGGAGGRPFGGPPSAGALSRQESLESPGRASSSYSSNGAAAATGGGGGGGAGVASFAAEASLHADIVLVPCGAHELLPMEPQYPADLFTTCLTTPIPMALRWFVMEHGHGSMEGVDPDLAHHIPGIC
jgi:regulator-associated protein of mTOR